MGCPVGPVRRLRMRARMHWLYFLSVWSIGTLYLQAQSCPAPKPMERVFDVPDVSKADVSLNIGTKDGKNLYMLQCHSAGYNGDLNFEYSGDFECRLRLYHHQDTYSTLLTEDLHQSRDWESRGRFFAANLTGRCAHIPQYGTVRSFRLRGLSLTLHIIDPTFKVGKLTSLKLVVTVIPDPHAQRAIAEIVPLPVVGVPANCKLPEYFVDSAAILKSR